MVECRTGGGGGWNILESLKLFFCESKDGCKSTLFFRKPQHGLATITGTNHQKGYFGQVSKG